MVATLTEGGSALPFGTVWHRGPSVTAVDHLLRWATDGGHNRVYDPSPVVPATIGCTWIGVQPGNCFVIFTELLDVGGVTSSAG